MNNEDYLNQISSSIRPEKVSAGNSFLSSKIVKIGIISAVVLVLTMIIGGILGGGRNVTRDRVYELKYRIDSTASVMSTYQPRVRSSILRSSSASLYGTFTNTSQELSEYIEGKYKVKEKEENKKLLEQAAKDKDELESEFFEARINGILDRIYAHKMAYEIKVVRSKEATLLNSTKDENLKLLLDKSINSLDNLYNNFNDFTEGNK